MRRHVLAVLTALSLASPALAEPEQRFELPAASALERLQLAEPAPAPRRSADLRDPWVAAGLTLASPLVLTGVAYGVNAAGAQGNVFYPMMAIGAGGPLALSPGYLYAGAPGRAFGVAAGGYVIQALGAVVGAPTAALLSGKEGEGAGYAFLGGLFIGPMVALAGYTLWAAHDAYQTAVRRNERAAAESAPTP